LAKEPDGIVTDWSKLPPGVEEFLNETAVKIGTDYPAKVPPGTPVKVTGAEGQAIIIAAKVNEQGIPTYTIWNDILGKIEQVDNMAFNAIDAGWDFDALPGVANIKKLVTKEEPKTIEEKQGTSPQAELPEQAEVPENAKPTVKGPLAIGTTIMVTKKGLGKVALEAIETDEGEIKYQTMIVDTGDYQIFDSITACCNRVVEKTFCRSIAASCTWAD